ncbi:unnamed protein product [Protopolystoma xenopodis]|uniref:Uncharacterized protein n=1 Tax=Protopolystoma xenopodis TaxID=117903 RepID=A0A3S5AG54_9PLAT|nr:unnamed protein product [Protopolystoma xenopodis]
MQTEGFKFYQIILAHQQEETYISSPDIEFVAATIQAIGRVASAVPHVAEACLSGLLTLMSRRNGRA